MGGLLLGAGCASKKPARSNFLFFPLPPDEPRIQFLTSFGAENDLGSKGKFADFIVGQERVYRPIWKPYGLAVRDGKVYVCDTQAGNVSIADQNGGPLLCFCLGCCQSVLKLNL